MPKRKNYKHKKNQYRIKKKCYLPKRKAIQFISYDDPRVRKELERKIYQDYLRDMYTDDEGGGSNE